MVESVNTTPVDDEEGKDEASLYLEEKVPDGENDESGEALCIPESNEKVKIGEDAINSNRASPKNARIARKLKVPQIKIDSPVSQRLNKEDAKF